MKIAVFTSTYTENLLIRLRLRSLIEPVVTFQMVGTDPGFIRLSIPFTWTARLQQSVSKCSGHIPNVPVGLKFFFLFHFVRILPLDGEVYIEILNSLSETRLQSCTTQRLGGILEVAEHQKRSSKRSHLPELHRKLATLISLRCEYDVTSYLLE